MSFRGSPVLCTVHTQTNHSHKKTHKNTRVLCWYYTDISKEFPHKGKLILIVVEICTYTCSPLLGWCWYERGASTFSNKKKSVHIWNPNFIKRLHQSFRRRRFLYTLSSELNPNSTAITHDSVPPTVEGLNRLCFQVGPVTRKWKKSEKVAN